MNRQRRRNFVANFPDDGESMDNMFLCLLLVRDFQWLMAMRKPLFGFFKFQARSDAVLETGEQRLIFLAMLMMVFFRSLFRVRRPEMKR